MANRITCGFNVAERQQDHFGSPMAACARRAAREERERKRGEGNRVMRGGRRGRSSETWHNDKPCFEKGVTDESDRRR